MDYQDYLAFKKTSGQAIREAATLLAGYTGQEVLLAVGSVAEGLGNSKSDLDLIMVSPHPEKADEASNTECSWVSGDCIVDLQILKATDVRTLIGRLNDWADETWNVSSAASFSADELLLLHRLACGISLSPSPSLQQEEGLEPDLQKVARLKLHMARHMARTVQVDMVGYKRSDDWYSLIYASQDLLGHAVDGLLAAFHKTNPNPKWRSRLLRELPHDWAHRIVSRSLGRDACQAVWEMHCAPRGIDEAATIAHASRTTTFGRAVFAWAECALVYDLGEALPLPSWPEKTADQPHSPLGCLELDVDFVLGAEGVHIARLNEFEAALQTSMDEFSIILQHDGITTRQEALGAAPDMRGMPDLDARRELFLDKVNRSGLIQTHSL